VCEAQQDHGQKTLVAVQMERVSVSHQAVAWQQAVAKQHNHCHACCLDGT